jgi:SAM-dependent methyltransferase
MQSKSFLRREEYEALAGLSVDGAILDVGGSKKSGYHELIKGQHTIVTGNIDASYGVDVVFDAEKRWPFSDSSFDGVLLVNILEHLYRYDVALDESYRVLKPGGIVAGVVPFLFNVHASPNDYFRFTKSTLLRMFGDRGFRHVRVRELGTGAFSAAYHLLLGFVRWSALATPLIWLARVLDRLLLAVRPGNKMSAEWMPLGYYFEATK